MSEPTQNRDAELLALRDRLRQARAERGACPPWDDIRADLLPGGAQREGRAARQAHVEVCPYCGEHVKEWRNSFDFESDRLAAIEKGVAMGIVKGAAGIVKTFGRPLAGKSAGPETPTVEREPVQEPESTDVADAAPVAPLTPARPVKPAKPPKRVKQEKPAEPAPPSAPAEPAYVPRLYVPPEERDRPLDTPPPVARPAGGIARILVVEMADGRKPPPSVLLVAQVLEAEVAQVDSVDELAGDPDLPLVIGVVLGGVRRAESWPDAVRHARTLVPKRPVILITTFGVDVSPGARRTLGEALQSEGDPAERLLLALDPELR